MARPREDGAAAQADPAGVARAEAPAPAPPDPIALQSAIAGLVDLAVHVLRALHGGEAARLELPAALSADAGARVDLEAAAHAEAALRGLRARFQDVADGIEPVSATDDDTRTAADAFRLILEGILRTRLSLPGDEPRGEGPPTEVELEQGLFASSPFLPPGEQELRADAWTVRNLTADPVQLAGPDGLAHVVPAFGERTFEFNPKRVFDIGSELARGEIAVAPFTRAESTDYAALLGAYIWLVPVGYIIGAVWGPWAWVGAAVALVALAVVVVLRQKGGGSEQLRGALAEAPMWAMQAGTYVVVVLIGVGLPAVAMVFGADLRSLVRHVFDLNATADEYLTLVGRTMQLVFIAIASLLPALLFFQFDRDRLSILREKFVHQIFRLDPAMRTEGAITAKYGPLIDEIYGAERPGRSRKLLPGRRAPIFVATLLIVLGWLYVLLNPESGLIRDEASIADLFVPRRSAVAFAFLGAYFFTLFALLRGYVRRDLRPKSYTDISVRIIAVAILAWVLELGLPDDATSLLVFAFVTGIIPQAALNRIRELWVGRSSKRRKETAALDDLLPLTDLEGIDLYDRTRLASEGVTNIEALAHHDLVELMLQTRIPVPRLIDWIDQAILHLHVNEADRATLRSYGIRTATDLLSTRDQADDRDKFLAILDGADDGKPLRMQVILDAMEDEEWMANLSFWHGRDDAPADAESAGRRGRGSTN